MNLEDIAKLAGVSRSTVSRVINDDPRVSDRARKRVKDVIAEHNFHPNAAARSLASRRSHVIGLLIPAFASRVFSDPWYPVVIQGCMDACQEQDLSLMLLMESETDAEAAHRLIQRTLRGRHLDGVVVATSMVDSPTAQVLVEQALPYVVIGRTVERETTWVDIDNVEAAREATAHLLGHDRRRAAMIAGPTSLVSSLDRVRGFRTATEAADVPATVHHADYDQGRAFRVALELLQGDEPPDAIFAASDEMAVGVVQAARRLGVAVPERLGLIGFDDLHPVRMAALGISNVRQPARELGHRAVELLDMRVADPGIPHSHEIQPTELVLRSSCGCHEGDAPVSALRS